jgi:hypothetical protein
MAFRAFSSTIYVSKGFSFFLLKLDLCDPGTSGGNFLNNISYSATPIIVLLSD